jgi:hypothetical protein
MVERGVGRNPVDRIFSEVFKHATVNRLSRIAFALWSLRAAAHTATAVGHFGVEHTVAGISIPVYRIFPSSGSFDSRWLDSEVYSS